jgi:hypothetical protein
MTDSIQIDRKDASAASFASEVAIVDVKAYMAQLGRNARQAARVVASASTGVKNQALLAIADALNEARTALIAENQKDLTAGAANGATLGRSGPPRPKMDRFACPRNRTSQLSRCS